ncbi:MAG: deacylase [Deltaproteobacteria bacterium]|nr:deacylase [Deltaproteobacteria bacterium]
MPVLRKLKEALDQAKISYEVYNHPRAFTAQEIAATQHMTGRAMAKVVILEVDGKFVMAVIPSHRMVNFRLAKSNLDATDISLATEAQFATLFPDCEIGAMPPFGNLFGLRVIADPALEKYEHIFFNAGNHLQTVRLRFRDFKTMVNPEMVILTESRKKRAA